MAGRRLETLSRAPFIVAASLLLLVVPVAGVLAQPVPDHASVGAGVSVEGPANARAGAGCQAPGPAGTPGCTAHRDADVNAIDPETVDDINPRASADADADGDGWGESVEATVEGSPDPANRAGFTASWVSKLVGGGGGADCGSDGYEEQERGVTINSACKAGASASGSGARCHENGRKTVKAADVALGPVPATEGDPLSNINCGVATPAGGAGIGCTGDLDEDGDTDVVVCNPEAQPSSDGIAAGLP